MLTKTPLLPLTRLTTFCAAPEDANAMVDAQTLKAFRDGGNQILTCVAGLIDFLEEPLKSRFLEVKGKINTALAGLPATDAVPAAQNANVILGNLMQLFIHAQDMIGHLSSTAKENASALRTTRASLPQDIATEVTRQINAKLAAGEYLTKADHEAKVTSAKSAASTDALAGIAKISQRRTALASANLPVPADDALAGDDAAYTARETEAKDRITKLEKFKLPPQRLTLLAWNVDKNTFDSVFATLEDAVKPAPGASGFVQSRGAGGAGGAATETASTEYQAAIIA